ncbi:MAG TPA: hypothetical protein PLV82_02315 [bacterium]|nr:hypothetical protein [bacterium]
MNISEIKPSVRLTEAEVPGLKSFKLNKTYPIAFNAKLVGLSSEGKSIVGTFEPIVEEKPASRKEKINRIKEKVEEENGKGTRT